MRKELEALRQSFRNDKAKEVATFQGGACGLSSCVTQ